MRGGTLKPPDHVPWMDLACVGPRKSFLRNDAEATRGWVGNLKALEISTLMLH